MNTSIRLILLLTITVCTVMAAGSYFMLRQRAVDLEEAARNEVRAHAVTLRIALEEDFASGRASAAQRLIDRLSENTGVYGVFLFDKDGRLVMASNAAAPEEIRFTKEAQLAVATGKTSEMTRSLAGEEVFSIISPLSHGQERIGAFEIAQPISFVRAEIARERRDILRMTALLMLTIFLVVLLSTHFSLTRPVGELLRGALAIGRGDLTWRMKVPRSGGEFAILAEEFNRMAHHLAEQREAAEGEAEKRVRLERNLRQSERLAVVGRLAAGVAHEIGAPLQVIDGRARQLLNSPEAPIETRQRNLTLIRSQSERIARMVRQLLNLARPYTLQLTEVDLRRLLTETLELLETNAAQSGVVLEIKPGDPSIVRADSGLLHQVFMNICLNAVQSISARQKTGGRVRVELIPAAVSKEGRDFVAVSVIDNGGGIAAEHFPSLFDPFFTTREIGQGTGLGLPVSKRMIEEHNGWIEATNNAEGGATFTIYLPCQPQNVAEAGHLGTAENEARL